MGKRSGLGKGHKAGEDDRRRYPLRKIVDQYMDGGIVKEVLECGHEQSRLTDIFGPTFANKRRCHQCAKEQKDAISTGSEISQKTDSPGNDIL